MRRRPHILGAVAGVALAIVAIAARSKLAPPSSPAMISECGGSLRELVIHAVAGDTIAMPVYQSFLPQLPADVRVAVLCADRAAFDELAAKVGPVSCRMEPVVLKHEITTWSRDRWIATESADGPRISILSPLSEDASEIWPARRGDARAGQDLAAALQPRVNWQRIELYFDGGDLLADETTVFVTPAVLKKNLHRTVGTREELVSLLAHALHKRVILLSDAPDHHAGMFMMAAGNRTMLVGDPKLGLEHLTSLLAKLPGGVDLSQPNQQKFDAVAAQLAAEGYRVVRIPTLVAPDAKTYFSYVNAITEVRDGQRIVYMPIYDGVESMNQQAAKVWESVGYMVRPVNCTSSYRHFGNLHCLVNVLDRSQPGAV